MDPGAFELVIELYQKADKPLAESLAIAYQEHRRATR
jgi:hypothetical protein